MISWAVDRKEKACCSFIVLVYVVIKNKTQRNGILIVLRQISSVLHASSELQTILDNN